MAPKWLQKDPMWNLMEQKKKLFEQNCPKGIAKFFIITL
jgi:hypothetical protein